MVTARLVAPGAMSPVSMLPSFRTTRCVTVSLFLKTTDMPPNAAGLGVKACLPLWPTIVMVLEAAAAADGADGADGAVVVLEDPPPLQPKAAVMPTINTDAFTSRSCMLVSSARQMPTATD